MNSKKKKRLFQDTVLVNSVDLLSGKYEIKIVKMGEK
jgi:hypothetical protein